MQHVYIENIAKYEGQTVELKGWLYNKRSSKKLVFLQVRDGTGIIQAVVFRPEAGEELYQLCDRMMQETSLIVTGLVRKDERSEVGFELAVTNVEIVAAPTQEYPLSPKEHGVDFLLGNRHLWLRSRRPLAIMRIRHEIIQAIHDFFDQRGFLRIDTPIFTPAACEGTSTLFETKYFDSMAYLTQSGQLYAEAAAAAFGKVYCFGPTFRAEKSKTRRHLTEFWMLEPEVAFLDLDGDMDLAEDLISYLVERVLTKRRHELQMLERDIGALEKVIKPFVRISYDDAVAKLKELGSDIQYGDDFGGDDETILTKQFDKPLMVHRYPADVKAFYMKRDPQDSTKALCVDVLAPEGYGEIVGGSIREDDYEKLLAAIHKHGLNTADFEWYLDLRRYGSFPHGGFGMGLERTVGWICGTHHIRECIPFPRMLERIYP
ncbi:MAG: asparagine--tRNA ligase [Myxococcales bacterium]|nr:MAG: asparagine--tRNA ligase [Myxococcales bacterium]